MKRLAIIPFGLIILGICYTFNSCEDFLEIAPPTSKIPTELVFQDDDLATSALAGIYTDLYSATGFAGGSNQSVVSLAGLSADEVVNNKVDPIYLQFQSNDIDPSVAYVQSLWSSMYKSVYEANAVIEGLDASTELTASVKDQLKGEALFVRAFSYFYLVNLFGDVPLATSTDYNTNNTLARTPIVEVYDQIKNDLIDAENLLAEGYVSTGSIRPNKSAATALLARVYLYTGDWARAEDKATLVIANGLYNLPDNLNSVFLATSKEAIWQLRPEDRASYTNEGYWFSVSLGPLNNVLRDTVMTTFEAGDMRKGSWTTSVTSAGTTVYLPHKYKRHLFSGLTDEYSMVLRLAEVYLIRAEARLKQDKLAAAIADIDKIRQRAGLPLIQDTNPSIGKDNLMLAVEQERRVEFLVEWGHRWLDLKRWNRAEAVLAGIKPGFTSNDLLYPIPASELSKNSNLTQNPGY